VKARPFEHLIISEASRLGREQFETGYVAKQIADHGVTMWTYLNGQQIKMGTAKDKFMMGVSNIQAVRMSARRCAIVFGTRRSRRRSRATRPLEFGHSATT